VDYIGIDRFSYIREWVSGTDQPCWWEKCHFRGGGGLSMASLQVYYWYYRENPPCALLFTIKIRPRSSSLISRIRTYMRWITNTAGTHGFIIVPKPSSIQRLLADLLGTPFVKNRPSESDTSRFEPSQRRVVCIVHPYGMIYCK